MDGFHLTREQLRQFPDPEEAFARRGAPWTFDPAAMAQRLRKVREAMGSADVVWPGFRHEIRDPEEAAFVVPAGARLILVEGLYLLHQDDGWAEVAACFDERWFLDTPVETATEYSQSWSDSHSDTCRFGIGRASKRSTASRRMTGLMRRPY